MGRIYILEWQVRNKFQDVQGGVGRKYRIPECLLLVDIFSLKEEKVFIFVTYNAPNAPGPGVGGGFL